MAEWQSVIRKRDFPMIAQGTCEGKSMIYLDSAATTQCARPVLWALEDYWQHPPEGPPRTAGAGAQVFL